MTWNDDSWRDSYDEWKLRSPYDDYDDEPECEHENYEIDVCTGRASCDQCSHYWYLSSEEIDADLDRQARYQDDMDREERRRWWRDLFQPVRNLLHRFYEWRVGRNFEPSSGDDDIPF